MSEVVLHQFLGSHFNEKARWALDFKGVAHQRIDYLPGPHLRSIKKLSGGPTSTPLLQHSGGYISGSGAIIDWLELAFPEPALYPDDEALLSAALTLARRFDRKLGPAVRTATFSVLINDLGYITRTFAHSKPLATRIAYRAMLPLVRPLMAKGNGVDRPSNVDRAFKLVRATLEEVAAQVDESGYLIGNNFTIADLTAAALLAPLADVEHPDMARPPPRPAAMEAFLAEWTGHPAIQWVREQYRRHRPRI